MEGQSGTLGIIAGIGELPLAIAETVRGEGRKVFVLALHGHVNEADVRGFPHAFVHLGELGKAIRHLKDAGCSEVTMVGKVPRVEFAKMKVDARGALALPKVIAAAIKGDDALLRAILGFFEAEGIHVIGSADIARTLLAPLGPLGEFGPTEEEDADIRRGISVVAAIGAQDIGQAAVICRGFVLAVEAAEGTDAMLARVATLPEALRGTMQDRKGVMVKAVKPIQERRMDLPVIGVRTVELASACGLCGIAVEAEGALIVNRKAVVEAADKAGIFVYGFAPQDYPRD